MTRVTKGIKARRRRNKVLKLAKGFHADRRTKYRHAVATVKRALHNAYKERRIFKRDIRKLWIVRINAAVNILGGSYSRFINDLGKSNIQLNRKMLAEIAATDFDAFKAIYQSVQKGQ